MTALDFEQVRSDDPEVAVVELRGELDLTNASELDELLGTFAATPVVILDLNQVSFVDSAALHCLFRAARERGPARLVIAADHSSRVFPTFEIVQLGRAAPIVPVIADGIARVRTASA